VLVARRHTGALVELRVDGSPSLDQIEAWVADIQREMHSVTTQLKRRPVLCTDLRDIQLFSQGAGERLINLMRADNPYLERNGILGSGSALLTMQVQRLFAEAAGGLRRRYFTTKEQLYPWLGEVLLPDEQARLRSFIARGEP
jgi:hypothetical protein